MTEMFKARQHWLFFAVAMATAVSLSWPVFESYARDLPIRGQPISPSWFLGFGIFAGAVLAAMVIPMRQNARWALLVMQVMAVMAMATVVNWAMMTAFLIIVAWQVGLMTSPRKAVTWAVIQTLAVVAALANALNPDLCWVIAKAFALQLLLVFTAQALRRESETAAALERSNRELRSAHAMLAANVRDAERLRISRELHDAWGHELTALGLQLEIASHAKTAKHRENHVAQAKSLARALLGKVRDVVSTLREAERDNLEEALRELARGVPLPRVHVSLTPDLSVTPDQAHALMRCAQEAVTNSVRHANAENLWLDIEEDAEGVRLVARDDGHALSPVAAPGSGLLGMRERIEDLGGRLAAGTGAGGIGFTVDAWLPSMHKRPA